MIDQPGRALADDEIAALWRRDRYPVRDAGARLPPDRRPARRGRRHGVGRPRPRGRRVDDPRRGRQDRPRARRLPRASGGRPDPAPCRASTGRRSCSRATPAPSSPAGRSASPPWRRPPASTSPCTTRGGPSAPGLSRLGVDRDTAELCLGHWRGDLIEAYDRDTAEARQRAAFGRWAQHVEGLLAGAADKVVAMSRVAS